MHSFSLDPSQAFSPASIGRAYLRAMGIRPILERQPDFPKPVLGYATVAYYGGWTEARIRRVPVPVVYVDFLSMYSTVCTLMGLWWLLTCERIETDDATDEVQALLANVTLEDYLNPKLWPQLVGLVEVLPEGDVLPCRAPYRGGPQRQIGVNPLSLDESLWYTVADAVASKLRTGRAPRVIRALRFVGRGVSPNLCPVSLRGAVTVNPRTEDFFKSVIEERRRLAVHPDLPSEERKRLDRFLKVLASSTSYGIFAEMRRHEMRAGNREQVTVYGLDEQPFMAEVAAPEEPGEFTFLPLGTLIPGAGRLMLSISECLVADAGGVFAFCDTDSMAIVATEHGGLVPCPGGQERLPDGREAVRALSWEDVELLREQFATLNPYDKRAVPGSILKLEDVNFDPITKKRRQLYCYAISAKRYALFLLDGNGKPILRQVDVDGKERPIKVSEHGLGHLLNPADPEDEGRDWITILWEGMVTEALGHPYAWPRWLSRPAISRISVSAWSQLELFDALNKGKPYADRIKPGNFLLSAHVAAFGHPPGVEPERFHLVAPWNPDPRQWLKMVWIDRHSRGTFHITVSGFAGAEGVARVKTIANVLADYRVHPEPKSLGPDGQPCGRATVGMLHRRPVTGITIDYVGKESNRLEEVQTGLVHDPEEVLTVIPDPRRGAWPKLVLPVLRDCPLNYLTKRTGRSASTVKRIRSAHSKPPDSDLIAVLVRAAGDFARSQLRRWGLPSPTADLGACHSYVTRRDLLRERSTL